MTKVLINKFRAKKNKAAFAQTLIKKLDKLEIIQVEKEDVARMQFRFPPAPHSGKMSLVVQDASKQYGDLKVLDKINLEIVRGDKIAFVKSLKGRFSIGVINPDGSDERLLTESFMDEGPTWSPNGRVIAFSRETRGRYGSNSIWSIDLSGRNLQKINTPAQASDPAWSPLLP